ncbi:hypothetical protein [Luteimonas sp. R10]|uniref:hypothetical protein n=1 Tax=Luteimonas sp. R10 TaxID=3108176 RepID=UPI00308B1CED|nr:hypothetical protein U3649_10965 [Luteimonas sp. R10]
MEPGTTYVWMGDGTLVIVCPGGTPATGRWTLRDGRLTLIEEGIVYAAETVRLDVDAFHLRIGNPGHAVEILLVPA